MLIQCVFFFNDTATTEIYTLSLHDALPISSASPSRCTRSTRRPVPSTTPSRPRRSRRRLCKLGAHACHREDPHTAPLRHGRRSEEHTSELQSRQYLVCRLLLEKKKTRHNMN